VQVRRHILFGFRHLRQFVESTCSHVGKKPTEQAVLRLPLIKMSLHYSLPFFVGQALARLIAG
jgi:hypothetical protein